QPGAGAACAMQDEERRAGAAAHQADAAAAQREPGGGGDGHGAPFSLSVSCTASCTLVRKPARAHRRQECILGDRLACSGAAASVSPAGAAERETVAAAER